MSENRFWGYVAAAPVWTASVPIRGAAGFPLIAIDLVMGREVGTKAEHAVDAALDSACGAAYTLGSKAGGAINHALVHMAVGAIAIRIPWLKDILKH